MDVLRLVEWAQDSGEDEVPVSVAIASLVELGLVTLCTEQATWALTPLGEEILLELDPSRRTIH
jgi:hypothetical protein